MYMRYQVPQFIEVEDKIFGPFTFKQFVYLVGGVGLSFIVYKFLPIILAIPIIGIVAAFSGSLAFYKLNNRPFIETLEAAFRFLMTKRLYIWQKKDKLPTQSTADQLLQASHASVLIPKISNSKLKDLAWSLDINETIYSKDSKKLENRQNLQNIK